MSLCIVCRSIPFRRLLAGEGEAVANGGFRFNAVGRTSPPLLLYSIPWNQRRSTVSDMASRAESCRICAIILRMVIEEWGWSSKDYNSMSLEERITAIPWHMIWIELPKAFGLYKNISISLGTVIHPTTYWLELNLVKTFDSTITSPLSNVVFPETLHLNTLHRMLSWLDKCNTSHSGCSHLSTRLVPLPTRVLDVSALPGQNQMLGRYRSWQELFQGRNCKLFQSTNGQTGRYAALSYCWGAELPLKTTRANLKAHKFAIGFDTLPRTLQDAVMIVRWMGIEFIWIDCLCILQDSKKDWEYEAARMADVYSNAYLTVAASRAAHCREGFLGLRRRNCPVSVKIEDEAGLFELYFQKPSKKAIESEALNSRGWAMQEGILSHRVLSFNESQMTWACAQDEVTEEVLEIWGQLYHAKQLILIAESLSRLEPGEFRTSYWAHFVQSYSARKVTYKTDTFPAISGVVRKIQQLTGDIYYAGLWKQHFLIGLLWSPKTTLRPVNYFSMEEPSGRLKSRQQWVAPSWSWASIEGAIEYQPISTGDSEYCARLEECRITYSGLDPLGALTTGFARLTGPVVSIRRTGGSRQEIQLRNGKLASATVEFDSVDYQSCRALMITPHQGICIKKIGQNTVTFSAKLDKLLWPALWLSKKAMPSVVANAYSRVGIVNVQSFDLGKSLTARDHVKPRSIVLI